MRVGMGMGMAMEMETVVVMEIVMVVGIGMEMEMVMKMVMAMDMNTDDDDGMMWSRFVHISSSKYDELSVELEELVNGEKAARRRRIMLKKTHRQLSTAFLS